MAIVETDILPLQNISVSDSGMGYYFTYDVSFVLKLGETYHVQWDGTVYGNLTAVDASGAYYIGNGSLLDSQTANTGEPFCFVAKQDDSGACAMATTDTTKDTHSVRIYQTTGAANSGADIVLRDRSGNPIAYPGIERIKLNTVDGGIQNFGAYDPDVLTPDKLAAGVTVGGMTGTLSTPDVLENLPIALDFSSGDQTIYAPDGMAVKSAVIQKPDTLIPENIAEGVDIAGIIGTFAAGGGGGGSEQRVDYTLNESGEIVGATFYGLTSLPDYACAGLEKLEWVDFSNCPNLTHIGNHAFNMCYALKAVEIPSTVVSFGSYVFRYCSTLTSLVIPDGLTSIGQQFCYHCDNLVSVNIPDTVTSIGQHAFNGCAFSSITIPASVKYIASEAFSSNSALSSVTFEDTSGWYASTSSTATSGTNLTLTDPTTAATYLGKTYSGRYWFDKT